MSQGPGWGETGGLGTHKRVGGSLGQGSSPVTLLVMAWALGWGEPRKPSFFQGDPIVARIRVLSCLDVVVSTCSRRYWMLGGSKPECELLGQKFV